MSNSEIKPTLSPDLVKGVQERLLKRRGILNGKELYVDFGESKEDELKLAIRHLQDENEITVKGDLEAPFGVFESVLVKR